MKTTFFRLSFALLILVVLSGTMMIDAQTVTYEILDNNPEDVENLELTVFPIALSGAPLINYNIGFNAAYRYKDKVLLNPNFLIGAVNDLNGKFDKILGSLNGNYKLSPLYNFNLDALYSPFPFMMRYKSRIVLHDGINVSTYTKVPLEHQVLIGLRCGYNAHRNAFVADGGNPDLTGRLIDEPAATPIPMNGKFNYSFHALKIGLGVYIKDNFSVDIGSNSAFLAGVKKDKGVIYVYADYLYPVKQTYHNMIRTSSSGTITQEYLLSTDNPVAKHGFLLGYSWTSISDKGFLTSGKAEFGLLPGPVSPKKNIFVSIGLGIGIGRYIN